MTQRLVYIAVLAVLALAGCTKNPSPEPAGNGQVDVSNPTQPNHWIDKYLQQWYLWPEELAGKTRNYDLDYESFFKSLLSKEKGDGKMIGTTWHYFSYIEEREAVDAPSKASRAGETTRHFGFLFIPVQWSEPQGNTMISFVVTHVEPGTDADKKGLRRGDEITSVDMMNITALNYSGLASSLRMSSSLVGVTVGGYRHFAGDKHEKISYAIDATEGPASPVLAHAKITENDKNIGYLAYSEFESGYPDTKDFRFNDELKAVFREFATAPAVDEVVIDLRHNGGGAVNCCRLLASMLVPEAQNQAIFAKNEFNSTIQKKYLGGQPEQLRFLTVAEMSDVSRYGSAAGTNLNLDRVYVLVNQNSASCSELLVSALRGVGVNVILIGETTFGKGVGMSCIDHQITNEGIYKDGAQYYRYTMWPVTFTSYNAKNERIPASGFEPSHELDEFKSYSSGWKALGDRKETMLDAAIEHITTGKITRATRSTRAANGGKAPTAVPQRTQEAGMRHIPEFLMDKEQ